MYDMIKIHFYLESRIVKTGVPVSRERPIILSVSYSSHRIKTYTGRKVQEQEWDKATERMKPLYSNADEFNTALDLMMKRVEGRFLEIMAGGRIPDPLQFQQEMKVMVKSESPQFFELVLRFMEANSASWSLSTLKKMKTFYSQLKEFSLSRSITILPGAVNQTFGEELALFFREKGLKDSSIKKNLDLLKWFMNWSLRMGLVYNRDFQMIRFAPAKNSSIQTDIYLKWEELSTFFEFEGLSKKEAWCRDIFCFISFTGIRFATVCKLNRESLVEKYIQFGDKQKGRVLLNGFALEIIRKYQNRFYRGNSLFPMISLITFHKHLKSAAAKSGLNRLLPPLPVSSSPVPVHSLMSAQAAINSFYANAARMGVQAGTDLKGDSPKSRILRASGALLLAEEKQLNTANLIYESFRSSGARP